MVVSIKKRSLTHINPIQCIKGFSDFLLIPLLILAFVGFNEYQRNSRLNELTFPLVNDFYLVDYLKVAPSHDPEYRYVAIKIKSIEQDRITYQYSNYGHNRKVSMKKHVQFDVALNYGYFNVQEQRVSRGEFEQWRENGIIYDGARPESLYIDGWLVLKPIEAQRGYEINTNLLARNKRPEVVKNTDQSHLVE